MKLSAYLLIILFLTGCNDAQLRTKQVSSGPSNTVKELPAPAKPQVAPPVSEITIERTPGMTEHPPPAYALTLRSDGTAIYIGAAFTERKGTYRAAISSSEFARLAKLVEDSGFVSLAPFYGPAVTDIPEVCVSVVRNGKRKTVVDWGKPFQSEYEREAPPALKQLEQQIDVAVATVQWVKVGDKTDTPRYLPK
jgi:hypothetical protein